MGAVKKVELYLLWSRCGSSPVSILNRSYLRATRKTEITIRSQSFNSLMVFMLISSESAWEKTHKNKVASSSLPNETRERHQWVLQHSILDVTSACGGSSTEHKKSFIIHKQNHKSCNIICSNFFLIVFCDFSQNILKHEVLINLLEPLSANVRVLRYVWC